jgi:shikimate dehydrogenase
VVLGAGGAALAVVDALVYELLVGRVRWVTRDPAALAQVLAGRPELRGRGGADRSYAELAAAPLAVDLLVNCTSVGMVRGRVELPGGAGSGDAAAAGAGGRRRLSAAAGRAAGPGGGRGAAVQDGLPMLLWQGVRALERWLGEPMPADVVAAMRAALS